MRVVPPWAAWVLATVALGVGCDAEQGVRPAVPPGAGGSGGGGGAGGGGARPDPGPSFDRFCQGQAWDAALVPARVMELAGEYLGVLAADPPFPAGTLETMKVIPAHPFYATSLRVAFGAGSGTARLRVMNTFGRSYPGGWPDIDAAGANLIPPIDLEVGPEPDPDGWIEIDLTAAGLFLRPTEHYLIVYEHLGVEPLLGVERTPQAEASRGMIHGPGEPVPYGIEGNFRLELAGHYFCGWLDEARWFAPDPSPAFAGLSSSRVGVADLDADGHDDLVLYPGPPTIYFGNGRAEFVAADFEPFPAVPAANLLVFGDLDQDGDRDAFASTYVGWNSDGDGATILTGDCNDADPAVRPTATEVPNGYDDDCDGTADDGTDTSDADEDGVSIAAGDCDDTRADAHPGAAELLDARDNDCNLAVDEIFVNRILLNDGLGHFAAVPQAGVETLDPSAAAALGDGNGDGWLDVYWGNWLEHYPDPKAVHDRYAVGQGDGTFVDVTEAVGLGTPKPRPCYGVRWNDYDDDGDQDILVSNYQLTDNYLWQNQGDGTFLDVARAVHADHDDVPGPYATYPGGHSYGASFGDVDNDGDLDLFQANLAHPRTMPWSDPSQFLFNGGPPDYAFADRRAKLGIAYDEGDINAALADYDNDGDLDLVVGSTYPWHHCRLYRNDGAEGFVDVSYEAGAAIYNGVNPAWSDLDEDGDLDLLLAGAGPVTLLLNRVGQDRSWVELDLVGTTTNRDAVGARVTLTAGGTTQLREVEGGGAHGLQHTRIVHFGLGDHTTVDALTVRWVGGATEAITGVAPRGRYRIEEGSGVAVLTTP